MNTKSVPDQEVVEELVVKFEKAYAEDKLRFNALPGVTTNWNPKKMVMLLEFAVDPNGVQQDLADNLGIDRSGISRKVNGTDWMQFADKLEVLVNMTKDEAIQNEAAIMKDKETAKKEVKDRKKTVTAQAFYTNLEEKILAAQKIFVPPLPRVQLLPSGAATGSPEHVVLLLSDWHVGQDFNSKETGGINEYNLDVFYQRAANLTAAIPRIAQIHSRAYRLPELHVLCIGDMVQGGNMNGEWGAAYNGNTDVCAQAKIAGDTAANMLMEWSRFFDKVSFTGVVGNHGRGGATKNSDKVSCNWDNVVYMNMQARLHDHKNISVERADAWWTQKNILGTEFLVVHGDYFGSSINSLLAANQKLQDLVAATSKKPFNILCIGHFHSHVDIETTMGSILVNGSFVGADMYSLQKLRSGSRPTQTIFGVHPEMGRTWKYCLDLEKTRKHVVVPQSKGAR